MENEQDRFWQVLEPEYFGAMMFCRKLTGDRDTGDDLYQDALVIAYTKFASLRSNSAFRPWLYRILVSTFRSSVRRSWWRRVMPLTSEIELRLTGDNPIETHTARRWLQRAFKSISAEEQALVTLYELEEWTISELAELYHKSESAIKVRLHRARRKMKKTLIRFSQCTEPRQNTKAVSRKEGECVAAKPGLD